MGRVALPSSPLGRWACRVRTGQPFGGRVVTVFTGSASIRPCQLRTGLFWARNTHNLRFFQGPGRVEEPDWLAEQLAAADDRTPVIVSAALEKERTCELCVATLNMFVSILGAEAGNLTLKVLATGGVYVGGGIPPRILSALENGRFMEAFVRKGRMSGLLARMPVKVILNPKAALLGAACRGFEL